MQYYRFKLLAPSGEVSSGTAKLPFDDPVSAVVHLERDGSTAFYVRKLGRLQTFLINLSSSRFRKKLSRAQQAELLNNLAMMLRAGITLTAALEEAAASVEIPEIANDLNNLVIGIQGGAAFSEAVENYRHIFPKIASHMVRIGEETGRLDAMLENAAEHLKRIQAIASDTKQALMYPSFIFLVMGGAFIFWAYYVAPKIFELFKEMDVTLPTLTVWVMAVSRFLQDNLIYLLSGLALVVVTFLAARRSSKVFKRIIDGLLLKTPLIGSIVSASTLAFISEYFALMMKAGIDVMSLMGLLQESTTNEIYREKLGDIQGNLTKGESIAESFESVEIFPKYVTRMIGVGEKSGTLPEQLDYVSGEYRKKLSIIVATIGKTIEPVVLIVAGLLFAVMIGGLLLPIYDLVSQVSG